MGSLAGLGFSVDEDVVGFFELLGPDVEGLLGEFEVFLGEGNDFPGVVDVGSGKSHDLVSNLQNVMSLGLHGISFGSMSSRLLNLSLSGIFLSGGKVQSKGGLSVVFPSVLNFLFLVVDDLDGSVDSIGSLELLFFNLDHVVLVGDVPVGDFDEVGG